MMDVVLLLVPVAVVVLVIIFIRFVTVNAKGNR